MNGKTYGRKPGNKKENLLAIKKIDNKFLRYMQRFLVMGIYSWKTREQFREQNKRSGHLKFIVIMKHIQ